MTFYKAIFSSCDVYLVNVFLILNLFLFSTFKANAPVDYYKKKFENVKRKARQRETLVKRQLETGGGRLSKTEQLIVKSVAYTDLSIKLGISAFGNAPRTDSDADSQNLRAPTRRLANALDTSDSMCDSNCVYVFISFEF